MDKNDFATADDRSIRFSITTNWCILFDRRKQINHFAKCLWKNFATFQSDQRLSVCMDFSMNIPFFSSP